MESSTVIAHRDGNVITIRMNRPERMNAVNEAMYQEIRQILESSAEDASIRALIITGTVYQKEGKQKQAFCAGADLKEHAAGRRDTSQKRAYIELAHHTTGLLYEFPKPTIAAINGPARGAGFELALNCDFIIMADTATLAFPEIGLGTFVGGGATAHLPAMIGVTKAKDLIYSGRIIGGPEAVKLGIALKCVALEELDESAAGLAATLAEKAPLSLKLAKIRLQENSPLPLQTTLQRETEAILTCMESADWVEGIRAFTERRKPKFKGK